MIWISSRFRGNYKEMKEKMMNYLEYIYPEPDMALAVLMA